MQIAGSCRHLVCEQSRFGNITIPRLRSNAIPARHHACGISALPRSPISSVLQSIVYM